MVEISVVVPVYGCRGCLRELCRRLVAAVSTLTDRFELIFVDDRSPDGCWLDLAQIARADARIVALRLSRNFGQDAAITAGLAASAGRWVAVLDCDLEEPPEVIPALYAKAQEGFDLVQGLRTGARRSRLREATGRVWLWMMLESDRRPDYGTLSILSRPVVDAFLRLQDRDREFRLILDWLGFGHATVPFVRQPRVHGSSSYTLRRLLRVAADGMFFRTTALLRAVVYLGVLVSIAGVGLACYETTSYFTVGAPPGYTTLVVLLLVLCGFVIVSVGVVGLYVGRIFEQVKGRPLYIIDAEVRSRDQVSATLEKLA
jgi:glycosyltransferase involved in cell wall biosynthesis